MNDHMDEPYEDIMLSEISPAQMDIYCIILGIWVI